MIINVIIAALISINIFKNFIDNGTELLTFSKPLSRTNIILAKISALITVDLAFSLATIFVAFVSF
jgi:ABC-type transport system involved in multi-copper enzyme maturation permease subunit